MKGLRIMTESRDNLNTKERTSTVIDESVLNTIGESMKENNYSVRKRSLWINEAILMLKEELANTSAKEEALYLSQSSVFSEKGKHVNVTLEKDSLEFIERCKNIMKHDLYSLRNNAVSRVIHLAITYRLVQEKRV
jgi:hypothetical protein